MWDEKRFRRCGFSFCFGDRERAVGSGVCKLFGLGGVVIFCRSVVWSGEVSVVVFSRCLFSFGGSASYVERVYRELVCFFSVEFIFEWIYFGKKL